MPSFQTVLFPPTSSVTVPEFRLCPDRSVKSFVLLQAAALKKIPTATLAAALAVKVEIQKMMETRAKT